MKKAFTLIELMVVISVIAILSTIALFGLRAAQDSANDTKRIAVIQGLRTALERYYADNSEYPTAYANLTTGTFTNYLTFPHGTENNAIVLCTVTVTAPCIQYGGSVSGYKMTFAKKAGGSLTYANAQ